MSTEDFYRDLGLREASGNPRILEKLNGNHYGLFQMGRAALADVGYYDKARKAWTGRDNINSLNDFLNNPQVQKKAISEYHATIYKRYHLSQYEGMEINGVVLTKSGLIAGAHLVGDKKFSDFLKQVKKGIIPDKIPADSNGVTCIDYARDFASYELDYKDAAVSSAKEDQAASADIEEDLSDDYFEEDFLGANGAINALLADPSKLARMQEQSFASAFEDLRDVDEEFPGLGKAILDAAKKTRGLIDEMQELALFGPASASARASSARQQPKTANAQNAKSEDEEWATSLMASTSEGMRNFMEDPENNDFLGSLMGLGRRAANPEAKDDTSDNI